MKYTTTIAYVFLVQAATTSDLVNKTGAEQIKWFNAQLLALISELQAETVTIISAPEAGYTMTSDIIRTCIPAVYSTNKDLHAVDTAGELVSDYAFEKALSNYMDTADIVIVITNTIGVGLGMNCIAFLEEVEMLENISENILSAGDAIVIGRVVLRLIKNITHDMNTDVYAY